MFGAQLFLCPQHTTPWPLSLVISFSYSKPSTNLTYQSVTFPFWYGILYTQCSAISSALVHTLQRTDLVTMATNHDTQLFLLHQHIPHTEYSNSSNHVKQGLTHSHQECESHVILHAHNKIE